MRRDRWDFQAAGPAAVELPAAEETGGLNATDGPSSHLKRERRNFGLYAARRAETGFTQHEQLQPGSLPSFSQHRHLRQTQLGLEDPFYDSSSEQWIPSSNTSQPQQPKIPPPLTLVSPRWDSLGASKRFFATPPTSPAPRSSGDALLINQTTAPNTVDPSNYFPIDASKRGPPSASLIRNRPSEALSPAIAYVAAEAFPSDTRPPSAPAAGGGSGSGTMVKNFSRPRLYSPQTQAPEQLPRPVPDAVPAQSAIKHEPHRSVASSVYSDDQLTAPSNTEATSPASTAATTAAETDALSRARGRSISSVKSSSTLASHSLPYRQSNEQLSTHGYPRPSPAARHQRMRMPSSFATIPADASLPHSDAHGFTSRMRSKDELSLNYGSQLTGSSTQVTTYTSTGTERSSVATKTSSVASIGQTPPSKIPAGADEGDLSVEDVMGLYEEGFEDDEKSQEQEKDWLRPRATHHEDDAESEDGAVVDLTALDVTPAALEPTQSHRLQDNSDLRQRLMQAASEPMLALRAEAETATSEIPVRSAVRAAEADSLALYDGAASSSKPNRYSTFAPSSLASETWEALQTPFTMPDSPRRPKDASAGARQPIAEDQSARDRYGFKKANNYISREQFDAWDAGYAPYLARRRKKWAAYLKEQGLITDNPQRFPQRNTKTKRFIRKGIPPEWRGAAWFYYAGGPAIVAKHPGVYNDLVKRSGLTSQGPGKGEVQEVDAETIERDLHRTFPDNLRFKPASAQDPSDGSRHTGPEEPVISSLRRVLYAFALYNPRIGYCQSLNFLAGMLLLFVQTEEQAFWLLNVMTRVYLPGTHEVSLEGSKIDLGVLLAELKEHMPAIWHRITSEEIGGGGLGNIKSNRLSKVAGTLKSAQQKSGGKKNHQGNASAADPSRLPEITLCMTSWFMSVFIGQLPLEATLRVWDILFYEGPRTLFNISLSILKAGENQIKAVHDPMEMFAVVQTLPRKMLDPNALIMATYRRRNGFGHLSADDVEAKRAARKAAIIKFRAALAKAGDGSEEPEGQDAGHPGARASQLAMDLDLAAELADVEAVGGSLRRKGTLFGRKKDKAHRRPGILPAEV
jgi:TBC1 domain family member 6